MSPTPTLSLDGQTLAIAPGQSIMEVAQTAGVHIPHLCYHPEFKPHGSCRVCVVEVDGRPMASCATPAQAGQVVRSNTAALNHERRMLLQLLFTEGNHFCPSCEKSGDCLLQACAYEMEMVAPQHVPSFPQRVLDASHPDVLIDHNRCILCSLCVRASRDVDHKNVFGLAERGGRTRLQVNATSGRLGDTDFAVTDRAASVCPVGAILVKRRGFAQPIGQRHYDLHPLPAQQLDDGADA